MSASLVGSEMCIRDRSMADPSQGGTQVPEGGEKRKPRGLPAGGDAQGPVSYTHLTLPTICSV
eukprot:9587335-Alexandrium_andersonii.AAC.1